MAARLSGLILAIALVAARESVAQEARDSSGFVQILTGELLRTANLARVADLLLLLDDWDVATVDGFTWQAAPRGVTPYQGARWLLLVDGQRIDLDLFGNTNLNRLPVPLEAISRVEVVSVPELHHGEFATAGLIHIHTREPASGLSAGGWVTRGSEIGDPGPFAFTSLATPNVDRFGDDASVSVAYGRRRWFAEASARTGEQFATDPAIVDRYATATGSFPTIKVRGQRVRLGGRLGSALHQVTYQRSSVDNVFLLDPIEAQLPTKERFEQLGLTGTFALAPGRDLRYSLTRSVNRTEARRDLLAADFGWKATTSTAGLQFASFRLTAGARIRHVEVETPQEADPEHVTTGSVYGEVAVAGTWAGAPALAAALTAASGEIGVAAALRQRWQLGAHSRLESVLGYARTVHADDNSIWAWSERGYDLLQELGAAVEVRDPPGRSQQVTADLAISARLGPGASVRAAGFWRWLDGLTVEQHALRFVAAERSFEGPLQVTGDAGGHMMGGELTAAAQVLPPLRMRLAYSTVWAIAGDDSFGDAWATVPRHLLHYAVEFRPVANLDLWTMLTYRGPSHWSDFAAVEAESAGAYAATVPGAIVLDLAVQKWFWKRRLRAHVGFRNILGSTLRYHPAGATWAPTVLAQLEARLE
ncbi:MAG TPA: hypothetical protein VHJ69_02855 [Gemmatimonadales bacterium]|nr:hypothetical protein [Gemmatimonadales bacterium]